MLRNLYEGYRISHCGREYDKHDIVIDENISRRRFILYENSYGQ